jgi:hypothetical protein
MRFVLLEEDQVRFDATSMFELRFISVGVHDADGHQEAQTRLTKASIKEASSRVVCSVSIPSKKP